MADVRHVVERLGAHRGRSPRPRAARRGRTRARRRRASPASPARAPRARARPRAPASARSRATTTTPSASSTIASPGRITAPPTSTGSSSSPATALFGPRTRTQRAHTGSSSSRSSSTSRTAASTRIAAAPRRTACVAEQLAHQRDRLRLGIVSTSTSPGSDALHRRVHHQVVALAAAHRARRAGRARAGDHLVQVEVDQPVRPAGLVDGGRPEPGELLVELAHSSPPPAAGRAGTPRRSGLAVARHAPRVVGALLRALSVVGLQVAAAPSSRPSPPACARSPA